MAHIYHDVSGGGKHFTLINGSVGNESRQNTFHYLQKGFNYGTVFVGTNTISIPNNTTVNKISFYIKTTDTKFILFSENTTYGYGFCADAAATGNTAINSNMFDSNAVYVDGVLQGSRIMFANSVRDGLLHFVELNNINYTFSNTYIGRYLLGGYDFTGIIFDLKFNDILFDRNTLPKHLTNNTDYLGNPLQYPQDTKSFLPSGCFLRQYQQPSLIQADKTSGVWFDPNGEPYDVAYETLTLQDPINEQVFIGNKDKTKKLGPISSHKAGALTEVQKKTERIVRDVVDDPLIEDPAFSHDITVTASDLTYSLYNVNGYTMNGIIDWGDGTTQSINTTATQTITKTYGAAGTYTVRFTGTMQLVYPNGVSTVNANKVVKINNWGDCGIRDMKLSFTKLASIPNGPITGLDQISCNLSNLFNSSTLSGIIPNDLFRYAVACTNFQYIFNACTFLTGQIPENLFRYCPNLTSVASAFSGCTGLSGQIPEELLKYNTKLTTVAGLFSGCTGITGSIPERLFYYCPLITSFATTFYNTNISGSIPSGLFISNTQASLFDQTFRACTLLTGVIPSSLFTANVLATSLYFSFYGCTRLSGQIPSTLLQTNTNITNLSYTFGACSSITSIGVDLFKYNSLVTTFSNTFFTCTGITSIPTDIFRYNSATTSFESTFYGCTGITSIPAGLFDYNTNVTTFASTFRNTRITTIPSTLFVNNTKVTTFSYTFAENPSLAAIPSNLFDTNVLTTTFDNIFSACTGITSIPTDLFRYNVAVTSFYQSFRNCIGITAFPGNIFAYNDNISFMGQNAAQGTFAGCVNMTGTIPSDFLSNCTALTKVAGLFFNCRSLTGSIPSGMLANKPSLTDAAYVFSGCSGLTGSIPSDLFTNSINLVTICGGSTASGFFTSCIGLTGTIPSTLFATNPKITSFRQCFQGCIGLTGIGIGLFDTNSLCFNMGGVFYKTGITSIPTDLFRYNINVVTFNGSYYSTESLGVFGECVSLITIPEDIFYYNPLVTDYRGTFFLTRNLVLPTRMFNTANLGKVTTWQNFLNVTSTTYSPTGTIQKIWSTTEGGDVTYTVQPTKTDAFNNCTALSNYSEIPVAYV